MKITQCLHTALLVSDLDRAKYFYGIVLELPSVPRNLNFPGAWYQIGDYQIHLILNTDFVGDITNREKWGRNAHIAFYVDNLNELEQKLQAECWQFQKSSSGRAAIFIRDPDGNVIEINQLEKKDAR